MLFHKSSIAGEEITESKYFHHIKHVMLADMHVVGTITTFTTCCVHNSSEPKADNKPG